MYVKVMIFALHIYFVDVKHYDYFKGCNIMSTNDCNDPKKENIVFKYYLTIFRKSVLN